MLDGLLEREPGREQQQDDCWEVTGVDAMRLCKRKQHNSFRERLDYHQSDGNSGKHDGDDSPLGTTPL